MMHNRRALGAATLTCSVVLVLLVLTSLLLPSSTTAQQADPLTLERNVAPDQLVLGQGEFTVTLRLQDVAAPCPANSVGRPADIVLVLDHSPSMFESAGAGATGSKMDLAKAAVKSFLTKIDFKRDQAAVVQFDGAANVVLPLGKDIKALNEAVDAITSGNATAIDQGVEIARRELNSSRVRQGSTRAIVALTDGRHEPGLLGAIFGDPDAPLKAAEAARRDGIRLITIGLGADADQSLLKDMAARPDDFYYAPVASDLTRIYQSIAQTVALPAGVSDVRFQHTYDSRNFELVPDSVQPPASPANGKLTWNLSAVNGPLSLTYQVKPLTAGSFNLDQGDLIQFKRCGAENQELRLAPALPVAVVALPTATVTATVTSRPTSRPFLTPRPTATPLPNTPAAGGFTLAGGSVLCQVTEWPLLLWLFLILFFLWWIWRLVRELGQPSEVRRPCRLLPWLLIPLLLLLLWNILGALAGSYCTRESLYFWRISAGRNDGGIFVTDPEGTRPARGFAAANQNQCVGCHTVSSTGHRLAAIAGGGVGQVVVHGLDGQRVLMPALKGSYVAFSPDGRRLAVSTDQMDIVIVDLATQRVTPLSGASDPAIPEVMPAWSPDGQEIAFVRGTQAANSWTLTGPCDIYVMPADGGTPAPLEGASGDGFNYYPAYSPDGRWIAFTRHTTGSTTYSAPEAEIFVVPSVGGVRQRLAANDGPAGEKLTNVSNSWPTWSRTGEWLAFTSKRDDPAYDIFITQIASNGGSGPATPLHTAAIPGVFEHIPFWGEPPHTDPLAAVLALWPWLIPMLLVILAWLLCRWLWARLHNRPQLPPAVAPRTPPGWVPAQPLTPSWQVAPTLIIGVGGTGRWVLTHVKKALRDGGAGQLPDSVRFVLLDTSERETTSVFHDARGEVVGVEFAGVSLDPDEMLLIGQNMEQVIRSAQTGSDPALHGWFPAVEYRNLTSAEMDLARGSAGRRPLARAGLLMRLRHSDSGLASEATGDPVARDAAYLWDALTSGCRAVVEDDNLVRVVIVGSVAGGMSGTLADLAYLARRAGLTVLPDPKQGKVLIEGYFATANVQARTPGANMSRLQINSIASLRELQRFQLSDGFAFPMRYSTGTDGEEDAAAQALDGNCDWRLFSDITLFGGDGSPETDEGKSAEPWATVWASMADAISFRMDRAVHAGANSDYRHSTRNEVSTIQRSRGRAVAASAGTYTIRFPVVDILDTVQARWATKLVNIYLGGTQADERGTISWDPAGAGMRDTAQLYASQFVNGLHEAGQPPKGMGVVGDLSLGQTPLATYIVEMSEAGGRTYVDYLQRALGLILNGSEGAALTPQAPRLGYAEEFASQVSGHLQQALTHAKLQASQAPTGGRRSWWGRLTLQLGFGQANRSEWQRAVDRIADWAGITQQALDSLTKLREMLAGTPVRGNQPARRGLYTELRAHQARVESRRTQMDQVAVRRYLWQRPNNPDGNPADPKNQRDLAEEWYEEAEARLAEHLGRFYWLVDADGKVRLGLIAFQREGQPVISLDASNEQSILEMRDEMLRLAGHVIQQRVDQAELRQTLPILLSIAEQDPEAALIQHAWRVADPHLSPALDSNNQIDGRHVAAVGLPLNVRTAEEFRSLEEAFQVIATPKSRLPSYLAQTQPAMIETTDRLGMTVLREYALMPVDGLPEHDKALSTYRRYAAKTVGTAAEPATLSPVFEAEHRTLEYERRLSALAVVRSSFRLLHPLVVLSLAREAAELYMLAFAAGWVKRQGDSALLSIPGQGSCVLSPEVLTGAYTSLDGRANGLLRLAAGRPEDAGIVSALRNAFKEPDDAVRQAWDRYLFQFQPPQEPEPPRRICSNGHVMRPDLRFCTRCGAQFDHEEPVAPLVPPPTTEQFVESGAPAIVRDLAEVTALAVFRRRVSEEEWNGLIMAEPAA